MTREEAIKNIKEHCYFANLIPQAKEALDKAIKALEQEPKTIPLSVYEQIRWERDIAISQLKELGYEFGEKPKTEQEPKTGQWIDKDDKSAVCSCCNRNNTLFGDYCKWCGAKMSEIPTGSEPQERKARNKA